MYLSTITNIVRLVCRELGVGFFAFTIIRTGFGFASIEREADNIEDEGMHQAASIIVKSMEELDQERGIIVWETPASFPMMQAFSLIKLYYLSTYHTKYFLHE